MRSTPRHFSVRRLAAGLIAFLVITPALGAPMPTHKVRMYMNVGPVEIELYGNESPLHVANYLMHVDAGNYDSSFIHRTRAANPSQPLGYDFFAQGGSFRLPIPPNTSLSSNPVPLGPTVPNEFDSENGLTNRPGSLAAARSTDPDSARSGWFINQSNNSNSFDTGPYTVYGQVTSGMGIINAIPFLPNRPDLFPVGSTFNTMPLVNGTTLVVVRRIRRIPVLAGDYDFSGSVTQADYLAWKAAYGSTTNAAADGNGDGVVNSADYVIWRSQFLRTSGAATGDAGYTVPEPSSVVLAFLTALAAFCRRRRAWHVLGNCC